MMSENDNPLAELDKSSVSSNVCKRNVATQVVGSVVNYVAGSVISMPKLEEPIFDEQFLPENVGPLRSILYTWSYNYRKFEYSVDPLRRGFAAWCRLALSISFFIVLPVSVVLGALFGLSVCIMKLCGVADALLGLIKSLVFVLLGVFGIVILLYLLYIVLAIICGWPIILPTFNFMSRNKLKTKMGD